MIPPHGAPPEQLQLGLEHHQAGRLQQADALYLQLLQAQPQHADALHLRGVVALQQGRAQAAVELIQQALDLRAADNFHCNLGNALRALDRHSEALAHYRQALALNPRLAEAWCNLGELLGAEQQPLQAEEACRRALALRPPFAEAHANLGHALLAQDRLDEAIASYRQALHLQPRLPGVHAALGDTLERLGQGEAALQCWQQALQFGGDDAGLHARMGRVLRLLGRPGPAIDALVRALQRDDAAPLRAEFVQAVQDAHFQAPQPAVRALLQRALDETWAEPAALLTPAVSLVACEPALQPALARPDEVHARAALPLLAADALLLRLLRCEPLNSIALERLLTAVRRQALAQALDAADDDDAPTLQDFLAALAQQCFLNDYVYACGEADEARLRELQARLDACFAAGRPPPLRGLLAHAQHAPLAVLAGAELWARQAWPAALAALFVQQVDEPALERRLRAALPTLTPITDAVSQQVQAQYEAHPYPRWVGAPPPVSAQTLPQLLRAELPQARWQPLPEAQPPQVLVAGCGTGQHAVRVARQLADAQVLAIDLSRASLGYAQRMSTALGLTQVRYAQADILQLGRLPERFDLIESAGVLHHLADPLAGWRVLRGLLKPGGLMFVALYSELGRRDVVAARERLAAQGLPEDTAAIRQRRQALMGETQAPPFAQFLASRDFYTSSSCRDLLFHVHEHRFTLPQLRQALDALDLAFLGFSLPPEVRAAYARRFPVDALQTELAHWHAFEQAQPATFSRMYQFWVQRRG